VHRTNSITSRRLRLIGNGRSITSKASQKMSTTRTTPANRYKELVLMFNYLLRTPCGASASVEARNNAEVTLCEDERRPRGGSGFEFSACPAAHGRYARSLPVPPGGLAHGRRTNTPQPSGASPFFRSASANVASMRSRQSHGLGLVAHPIAA
jgi:hypothetical protein